MTPTSQKLLDSYAASQSAVLAAKISRDAARNRLPDHLRARMKVNGVSLAMLCARLGWKVHKLSNFISLGQPMALADLERLFDAVEIKPTKDEKGAAKP